MKVYLEQEGDLKELPIEEVVELVMDQLKEYEVKVPDYDADNDGKSVIKYFIEGYVGDQGDGNDVDWSLFPEDVDTEPFKAAFKVIENLIGDHKKNEDEYKKNEAQIKEKDKQEKENEAEKTELRKKLFVKAAEEGVSLARSAFKKELASFKDTLPKGMKIETNDSGGSGIVFDDDINEEELAKGIAFLAAQSDNTQYLKQQLQFLAGGAVNHAVRIGIYKDNREASKHISENLAESINYRITTKTLENYARMDQRIPFELRSLDVDPSAYIAVALAGVPKLKKGEKKEEFKKREEAYVEDREKLLEKMKEGKAKIKNEEGKEEEIELTTRKNVVALVQNMQIKHGLMQKKDPDELSVGDWLKQFFYAFMANEYLLGIAEEGKAIFKVPNKADHPEAVEVETADGENIKIVSVDSGSLADFMEEAKNNLQNVLFSQQGLTMKEFMDGVTTVEVARTKEVDGKQIPIKDPISKKKLTDSVEVPCYPNWPFKKSKPETVKKEEAA